MRFLLDSSNGSDLFIALCIVIVGVIIAMATYIYLKKHNFGGNGKSKKQKGINKLIYETESHQCRKQTYGYQRKKEGNKLRYEH